MLVRTFRFTDKLSHALLKVAVWVSELLVAYVELFTSDAVGTLAVTAEKAVRGGATALAFLAGGVMVLAGWLWTGGRFLVGLVTNRGAANYLQASPAVSAGEAVTRRPGPDSMARRAQEVAETIVLVEDPLKARNRTLSALTVILLLAVVGLILWATSPTARPASSLPLADAAVLTTPNVEATPFATAVPTVTPRPAALNFGGSLVYTLRENGQDDLWATIIGEETPVRLTNHPADDRDPAWSPSGSQLAFASHRDGNWELYVLDVLSGDLTRLTFTPGFEGAPSWSPDGEWLVYEAYIGENLDVYAVRVDGTQGPLQLTFDPAPDFEPAWSPGGREVAFVSWREGSQDVFVVSLDDLEPENVTNSPDINEDYPSWSPDGLAIAYSALADGIEVVYVKSLADPTAPPSVIDRGSMPTWSPDSSSLVYVSDQAGRPLLVAGQYRAAEGTTAQAVALRAAASDPDWTANTELRDRSEGGSGLMAESSDTLYNERINRQEQPPYYRLVLIDGLENAPSPLLSDRVNDSFVALRQAVVNQSGQDFLGDIEDAFWQLDRLPEPGQERLNWHLAGRAFSLNRNLIFGFPAAIEVAREDLAVHTYWQVYLRAVVQDGRLGEPLRRMPWDFTARSGGDVVAYDEGGRLRGAIPSGYYVDFTQLAGDYGWSPVPADRTWRYNFGGVLFWEFIKTDGLSWQDAMLELYGADELTSFLTDPTPFPTPTLAPPTATPEATTTPVPPTPVQATAPPAADEGDNAAPPPDTEDNQQAQ